MGHSEKALTTVLAFLAGNSAIPKQFTPEMKVLLTSDLHLTVPWFDWLNTKAAAFDLICIGGDFLDLFGQEPKPKQVSLVQSCLRRLAAATTVAICSGNHDSSGPIVPAARGPTPLVILMEGSVNGHWSIRNGLL
jgi:predicted MPP superfamily phosphohydrolase